MKKIIFSVAVLASMMATAQKSYTKQTLPDSLLVVLSMRDEMDNSVSYIPSRKLFCIKDDRSMGFTLAPQIRNNFSIPYLVLRHFRIGTCDESGGLRILFEDDTTMQMTSFSSFNCDGNAAFEVTPEKMNQFSSKRIKKIRYTNGRSGENYTHEIPASDRNYMIRIFRMVGERQSVEYKD